MLQRLGDLMALLGPRYKTLPRQLIWEKAEKGDMTAFQRRLQKAGGIQAVVGVPGQRPSGSAPVFTRDAVTADSDGKARAAWLQARSAERVRRNRSRAKLANLA